MENSYKKQLLIAILIPFFGFVICILSAFATIKIYKGKIRALLIVFLSMIIALIMMGLFALLVKQCLFALPNQSLALVLAILAFYIVFVIAGIVVITIEKLVLKSHNNC